MTSLALNNWAQMSSNTKSGEPKPNTTGGVLRLMDIQSKRATLLGDFTPFRQEIYCKRKEYAPYGSKFFLFRVDPFSDGP